MRVGIRVRVRARVRVRVGVGVGVGVRVRVSRRHHTEKQGHSVAHRHAQSRHVRGGREARHA